MTFQKGHIVSAEVRNRIGAAQLKHGHSRRDQWSGAYRSWAAMIQRCTNPKQASYAHYGGNGIQVAEQWRGFANFLADMGDRPLGMSLDRIDSEGNYEPGNCRWADIKTQRANRRACHCPECGYSAPVQEFLR